MRRQRIKPPKIHRLRTMVARNFSRIESCCGTDSLQQVCEECNIRVNLMGWALNNLAREFARRKKSINFRLKTYCKVEDDSLIFKMVAKTTKEGVFLGIPAITVHDAESWQNKIRQSARQSDKKK